MPEYLYYCKKCEHTTTNIETMTEHNTKGPGKPCELCTGETIHQISGSPMFRLNWTDPHK